VGDTIIVVRNVVEAVADVVEVVDDEDVAVGDVVVVVRDVVKAVGGIIEVVEM
jgi:hypothetical protein